MKKGTNVRYQISNVKREAGFTLVEVLLYVAIIGIIGSLFAGILVVVTRVGSRTTSSAEVEQQTNFVIQNIQRHIRESSLIDIATNTPSSTLDLRVEDDAKDPTLIYLANNQIYLQEGSGEAVSLTADRVKVNNLIFTKTSSYPGHDSLQVNVTVSINSQNPEEQYSKTSKISISRIGTATFGSNLVPGLTNNYDIGSLGNYWKNLQLASNIETSGGTLNFTGLPEEPSGSNGKIYYNSSSQLFRAYSNNNWGNLGRWRYYNNHIYNSNSGNVGINTTSPSEKLDIIGNLKTNSFKLAAGAAKDYVLTSDASGLASWLPAAGKGNWKLSGNDIYNKNSGDVGINILNPVSKLHLYDGTLLIDGPTTLTLAGNYDPPGNTRGIYVSGKYAYLASSGLRILDISDPANPIQISHLDTDGSSKGIHISGRYAYIADDDEGLNIIDISNISSPIQVGNYNPNKDVKAVYVSGKYAYLASSGDGLLIIDITDPSNPVPIGNYNTAGDARGIYIYGRYAYVASGSAGLSIIDISNPASPLQTSIYDTPGNAEKVYVSGQYAYVADGSSGLRIIDISNPSSPLEIGSYNTSGDANGIKISGKYAYVAAETTVLEIIDISNPPSPQLIGNYDNENDTSEGVYVAGRYAYVTVRTDGINIIDIKGADITSANIDDLDSNNINIKENLDITASLTVGNSLTAGRGITSDGEIASSDYLQFGKTRSGSPPPGDCDSDSERGRITMDTSNSSLYICMGASRGWDWASLSN